MTRNTLLKSLFFNAFLTFLCSATWAASLELGHIRAGTRGWEEVDGATASQAPATRDVENPMEQDSSVTEEVVSYERADAETAAYHVDRGVAEPEKSARKKRVRGSSKRGGGLILIGEGRRKTPQFSKGYLAVDVPPALRFSDIDPVDARPPSPALPEFNFLSSEYMPYLIETRLSEDELNNAAMLSEVVIELAPHEVISGKIDTRTHAEEVLVEHFDLDEQRTTVLRPEEVLIFFETDSNMGKSGAMVPFSPANPSTTTIRSSATLTKE